MSKEIILTGVPRSGTTLACSLLNRLPNLVALNETMDVSALSAMDGNAACVQAVARYLADVRQAIVERGEKPERRLRGGGDNMFLPAAFGERRWVGTEVRFVPVGKPLRPGFTLALKHPNAFAALLPELRQRFECWALVRNPLAVLASWRSLDHPLRRGHALIAEALDPALTQQLAAIQDDGPRRLALLDWYFRRFLDVLGAERILRYEDIIASNGACLAALVPEARQLPELLETPLRNQNDGTLRAAPSTGGSSIFVPRLRNQNDKALQAAGAQVDAQALLALPDHACWRFYDHAQVTVLRDALCSEDALPATPPPQEPQEGCGPSVSRRPPGTHKPPNSARLGSSPGPPASGAYQPKLDFVIVGAQKCGTTALSEYLREHPQIGMPLDEGHVFDAPDFSPDWSPQEIDELYAPRLAHCQQAEVFGEATPMYMFLPEVAESLRRYNPNLKLILLLRDRVERAISHYYMEKGRGNESIPLWLALLAESLRTRCPADRRRLSLALRRYSYRSRGLYSWQIHNLYQHFPANQIQVIGSQDLLRDHHPVLRRLFAFLGVAEDVTMQHRIARAGNYPKDRHRFVSWLLRLSYLREARRMKVLFPSLAQLGSERTAAPFPESVKLAATGASSRSSQFRKPRISIVIAAYKMQREAPRTLLSFLPPLQKCVEDIDYEIVVVDNGSPESLMLDGVINTAERPVRLVRVEPRDARVSPANAVNAAVREHATGDFVMVCIDGARLASSHLVCRTAAVLARHPNAFVYVGSRHLGSKLQMQSVREGYDRTEEDKLLNSVAWNSDLDQLFSISVWAGSHPDGNPLWQNESNAFALSRDAWKLAGGYNENFSSPGGGLCNLELFTRLVCKSDALNVLLLGEATFHQVHGGIATSNEGFFDESLTEYSHVTGQRYSYPSYRFLADIGERHNRLQTLSEFLFSDTPTAIYPPPPPPRDSCDKS